MPNIEIYGLSKTSPKAFRLRRVIEERMQAIGLENESTVVTIVFDSIVTSCNRERTPMPFIRICSTDAERVRKITETLEKAEMGFDIETLILNSFIPKTK